MSAVPPAADLGGEREIDLRRWRQAVLNNRWFVVAGLVIGLIVGGVYSLSGGSDYQGTVTIQPAQPFSPTGSAVLNYASSPLAIQLLVNQSPALIYAAKAAKMPVGQLTGHVSTTSVSTGSGPVSTRGTVLIEITVSLPQAARAEAAANALGQFIRTSTESPYVRKSLAVYALLAKEYTSNLATVNLLINSYELALKKATFADPIDKLVLASELNDEVAREGNLQTEEYSNEQNQTLAANIELAQIISPARAVKVTARSRRDSVIFGGVIGLIIGLLVALGLGLRPTRSAPVR